MDKCKNFDPQKCAEDIVEWLNTDEGRRKLAEAMERAEKAVKDMPRMVRVFPPQVRNRRLRTTY